MSELNVFAHTEYSKINLHAELIYTAFIIRETETRLLELFSEGKLNGTIHTCIGQEFVGVTICKQLIEGDSAFSTHRCHGHYIAFTADIEGLVAEIYGKLTGVCAGRGGSQHLIHKKSFFSNGIQGGLIPIAAGMAFAKKLKKTKNISVIFIGDGTLGEGIVYEALNIISKWQLPVLIVLENNHYAQSTHQSEVLAGDILARVSAFGIESATSSTVNWQNLYTIADNLIAKCRSTAKPAFLMINTYRLKAHSKGDDNRDPTEINLFAEKDPLNQILQTTAGKKLAIKAKEYVDQVIKKVSQDIEPENLLWELSKIEYDKNSIPKPKEALRLSTALNQAFINLMKINKEIYFIGEDVKSPYGGAFKIAKDLSLLFPDRVLNTPISEAAIVGIGTGLAMAGFLPIIEIMFGDFILLAMDQIINHAAKFRYISNNKIKVPLIIRTPMGAGRAYGPTHSQTLEKHIMGTPGLRIMALNNLFDPYYLYAAILKSSIDPTIIIENKLLYNSLLRLNPPIGYQINYYFDEEPIIHLSPTNLNPEVIFIAYGGLVETVINAIEHLFIEHEVIAQFICPVQIYPFNIKKIMSLLNGNFIFVIEEGQNFAGFSAEIIAQLVEISNTENNYKITRIGPVNIPIPSSKTLENEALVNKEKIISSVLHALNKSTPKN